jgi:cysteine desulfurase
MDHDPIDLDHNATTPLDPAVADAMLPFLRGGHGNPSSSHALGRRARAAVEGARAHVAALLGAEPDEIILTSGGSEANNTAIFGVAERRHDEGRHLITSAVEHPAVLAPLRVLEARGWSLTVLPVDGRGRVDPADLARAVRPDTVLVSVMHANNEVGTIEPIAEISGICREHGAWLHTDAAQTVGKIPVDVDALGVDLLTVAGHKFHGPKGVGALYVRRGRDVPPLIHGAGHERGRRAGTENVLAIVGLGEAARLARARLADGADAMRAIRARRDRLRARLESALPGLHVNGDPDGGLPNTLSAAIPGVDAAALLASIGDRVAASPGAACHSDGMDVSAVLTAMKVPLELARGTIRFSLGHRTTDEDVDEAAAIVAAAVARGAGRQSGGARP